jgi:WD40 repeat protein
MGPMTATLHSALLRFWRATNGERTVAGTGFLASGADGRAYALTCGHVANLALGRARDAREKLTFGTTKVDLIGRAELTLELVGWFSPPALGVVRPTPVADIAVFAPRPPFSAPFLPPLRIEPPARVVPPGAMVAFHSFGFMGTDDGTPAHGNLTAVDAGGWFVADGDEGFRRFIEEGLSGAPVFANGAILGMVTQRLERELKQGLVIPAFALAQAWPPLAQPYPGLPAFDLPTAHLYFGGGSPQRPGELPTGRLKQLVERLANQRLLALVGASGSGKSSLAKAGFASAYEQKGWLTIVFRPGLQPLRGFADAIAQAVEGAAPGPERIIAAERWVARLEAGELNVALDAASATGAAGTLIIVDQFEEFFTSIGARETDIERQRAIILPQLLAAVDRPYVHCLLTARLDLIERMITADQVAARMLTDPHPFAVLTSMSPGEVREAVEGPAAMFGVGVDPAFAADLAAEATRGEGRLPLLQAALRQAWARIERPAEGSWRLLRPRPHGPDGPAAILDDAVGERADAAVKILRRGRADRPGITEDELRRVLLSLVRMVDGVPARRLVARSEAASADWSVLEALAAERLVTLDGEHGTAELVHEALMSRWPMLAGWIKDEAAFLVWRDRFDREFAAWVQRSSKAEDFLRRQDVAIALDWLNVPHPGRAQPMPAQANYIRRSHEFHESEREQQRRLLSRTRRWLAAATVAGLAALIALAFLRQEVVRANSETEEAAQAKRAALLQESRAIAALAQQESDRGDQPTAMLLALEVLPAPAFGGDRPLSAEAEGVLRQAWMRNRETLLVGHTGGTAAVSFSPDGRRVVTASWDHTARVWDLSGPRPVATVLEGHKDVVLAASFSPDGRRIVTASKDHTARVWDLSGPRPTAMVLEGHTETVLEASFSPDGQRVVTASEDGNARVWDLSGPRPVATVLKGHTAYVLAASFSQDGRRIVTASIDRTARVWDLSGPRPVATVLEGHKGIVTAASFSPDGRRVVTASDDETARVWDLSGPRPVATVLDGHGHGVTTASFSSDGRLVVTGSGDGGVRVWDLSGPAPVATQLDEQGDYRPVRVALFSPDGHSVVTASDEDIARVWDLTAPSPVAKVLKLDGRAYWASFSGDRPRVVTEAQDHTVEIWEVSDMHPFATILAGHMDVVFAASFSPDGRRVLTASKDLTARVWDLSDPRPVAKVLEGHTARITAASFSPDGLSVVTASDDDTARVWDLSGPRPVATLLEGHKGSVTAASFSPDGRRVLTASEDGTARVWDLSAQRPVATVLEGHTGAVTTASFSPDGHRVLTASLDKTARVWDLSGPRPVPTVLEGHGLGIRAASFSPDGRRVITASDDYTARVWNLSGTRPMSTMLGLHRGGATAASFSPDGRSVLTAAEDGELRVWDLAGPRPVATELEGATDKVEAVSFSPDGRHVVAGSSDGTARVWDLSGPRPVGTTLIGHSSWIMAASFSPDGRRIVTASQDYTARVWAYPDAAELSALVLSRLSRCLSAAQRAHFGLFRETSALSLDSVRIPDAQGHCPR